MAANVVNEKVLNLPEQGSDEIKVRCRQCAMGFRVGAPSLPYHRRPWDRHRCPDCELSFHCVQTDTDERRARVCVVLVTEPERFRVGDLLRDISGSDT